MDYKQVFLGLLIAFVAITAITYFATDLNTKYSGTNATTLDTGFMQDSGVDTIEAYAGGVAVSVGNSTAPPSVSSSNELTQSKNTFSLIRSMVDFVPNILQSAGNVLGIPQVYIKIAIWAFVFGFGITLAYILILGVKNFL